MVSAGGPISKAFHGQKRMHLLVHLIITAFVCACVLALEEKEGYVSEGLFSELATLKNATTQLAEGLKEVQETQANSLVEIESRFLELEHKLGAFQDGNGNKIERRRRNDTRENATTHWCRLHQNESESEEMLRQHQGDLKDSMSKLHAHVSHLSSMHNITGRLRLTADLVLEERWYEALLHWSFAENHLLHQVQTDAQDILTEYLRTIIHFVYSGHSKDPQRLRYLSPLFQFVQKLSQKDYKVYAYDTLTREILSNREVFDGSEIFILAHFTRKIGGLNGRAWRGMPEVAKILTSGMTTRIVYLGETFNGTINDLYAAHSKFERHRATPGCCGGTLDLHTKADMMKKSNDVLGSLKYPVYASKELTYHPHWSAHWIPIYERNTSYFHIKNQANSGFLNVPVNIDGTNLSRSDGGASPLLNCVIDEEAAPGRNLDFNFFYLDNTTFGIESASLRQPVIIRDCPHPNGTATASCLTLGEAMEGHWTGARFSAIYTHTPRF